MKKSILVLSLTLMITGCTTTYQKLATTGGYSSIKIDKNIFKVSFSGNRFTQEEEVSNYTLLRSAEITLKNHYKYFKIISKNIKSSINGDKNTVTIKCFNKKPKTDDIIYNAIFVEKSIKEKYRLWPQS